MFFLHTSCVQCRITKQWCTIIREGEGMIVDRVSKLPPALFSGLEPRTLRLSDRGASLLHQSSLKTDLTSFFFFFFTNPTVVKRSWTVSNPERTGSLWATRCIKYPWTPHPALLFHADNILIGTIVPTIAKGMIPFVPLLYFIRLSRRKTSLKYNCCCSTSRGLRFYHMWPAKCQHESSRGFSLALNRWTTFRKGQRMHFKPPLLCKRYPITNPIHLATRLLCQCQVNSPCFVNRSYLRSLKVTFQWSSGMWFVRRLRITLLNYI